MAETGYKLRSYQQETINRLRENYNKNKKANLCVLATGLGKTVIATEFHKQFKTNEPTLFIVDRIELAWQAKESFETSDPNLSIGVEMNKYHASEDDDVVIACVHSIGRKGSYRIGKFDPDHFSKIIVDEAHLSVSDIYVRVLNYLGVGPDNFDPKKILVGLTATPMRSDNLSLGYVYDEIPVNYDIRFGIKEGYLTDISLLQVDTNIDISDVRATQTDFDTEELDKAINVQKRNATIVKSYLEFSRNERALVYCNSVDHAYAITQMFNNRGIPSKCIEAHTKRSERKRAIKNYKKGNVKVLTNYGTLTLGFNAPETSTIILARPIRSEGLITQIVGRGIRPSKNSFVDMIPTKEGRKKAIDNSNKPYCKVIDIHDNLGDHDIASVPSLFGLNPKLKTDTKERKFFEEVVEPLEDERKERKIDITEIENLDEVDLLVKKKKLNISSLRTPQEITKHTNRDWKQVNDDMYEITYPKEKKSILIEKNNIGKWDVIEQSAKSSNAKKLNDFYDLSAAIKLGDDYADRYYDTSFTEEADWKRNGVTKPQFKLLKKLYRGRIGVSDSRKYSDTGVPKLFDRQLGEPIRNAGDASELISQKTGK